MPFELSEEEKQIERDMQAPEPQEPEGKEEPKKEPEKEAQEPEGKKESDEKKKDAEPDKEKRVPLAALNEARYENRRLKQGMEELKREFLEFKKAKETPKDPAPNEQEDPLGWQAWKLRELEQQQKQFQARYQTDAGEVQRQNFINHVERLQSSFRQKQPDYDAAFEFVKNFETKALEHVGITDPDRVSYELGQRALGISVRSLQNGRNPAEAIYQLAKSYGYRPTETKTAQGDIDKVPGVAEHLNAIKKGQEQASKTLSGGGETDANATIEQLLKAEGKEFDELWNKIMPG